MADPFYEPLPVLGQAPWTVNDAIQEIRNRIAALDDTLSPEAIQEAITEAAAILNPTALSDSFISDRVEQEGSFTDLSLKSIYPVFRLWNGSSYPARLPNALNIFIGPNPGTLTAPDIWAGDGVTLDGIIAAVNDSGSDLGLAVRAAVTPTVLDLEATTFAPIDNRPATMGTLSASANSATLPPVWLFPDSTVTIVGRTVRIPVGWNAMRVWVHWSHNLTSPSGVVTWLVRLMPNRGVDDVDLSSNTGTTNLSGDGAVPATRALRRQLLPGSMTVTPGDSVVLSVARSNTTVGGSVGLVKIELERTA